MINQHYSSHSDVLELLLKVHANYNLDRPFIVGGKVRDILLDSESDSKDIDITTGSTDCVRLGILFSTFNKSPFKMFEDRHIRTFSFGKSLDFSPGFLSFSHPNVLDWMKKNKPNNISKIEFYSRDFTINSLYQDFESGEIFDPTGMGTKDIGLRLIKTPIPPEIILKNDPRRIFRAIRLSSQFNLMIDPSITEYVKNNSEIILDPKLTTQYMTNEINRALQFNQDKTIENIFDLGLFKIIPLAGLYSEYLIKNKLLSKYLS